MSAYITIGVTPTTGDMHEVTTPMTSAPGLTFTHHQSRRRKKMLSLAGNRSSSLGVEIGPLNAPLALKSEGAVIYVDYTDTATLRAKYAALERAADIVEVDAVWGKSSLMDALASRAPADYVVASHVIEHVPDLVTWLEEISCILRPGGTLHLAVPDHRYTFDLRRHVSRLSDVLYARLVRARQPLPHQLLDFEMNVLHVGLDEVWNGTVVVPDRPDANHVEHAMQIVRQTIASGEYYDTHCWVFAPLSFAELMLNLCQLGLLSLACGLWFDTERGNHEFFVVMIKEADPARCAESWSDMAKELRAGMAYG